MDAPYRYLERVKAMLANLETHTMTWLQETFDSGQAPHAGNNPELAQMPK